MASPQLENGYTRTANELSEAIMQSDFSKRQLNILNLIIRMSYGCGKKSALFKHNDFELVGIYKTDIKKELDYLTSVKVISINYMTDLNMIEVTLNKNYDQWRVSLVKGFCADKWELLLRRNLENNVSKILTEVSKTLTPVSEILTDFGNEVSNLLTEQDRTVSKLLTSAPENSSNDANSGTPKERSFKEKDLVVVDDQNKTPLSPQTEQQDNNEPAVSNLDKLETIIIPELFGRLMASPLEIEAMKTALVLTNDDIDFILAIVRKANQAYKPKFDGDKIKSFTYFLDIIKREWSAKQARDRPVDNIGNKKIFLKEMNYNGGAGTNRGDPSGDPVPISKLIIRADSDMSGVQT